jgi:hypothetical protein
MTSNEWIDVMKRISSNYSNNEFILMQGHLESYIKYVPNNEGKMDNVIKFCKSHFDEWVKSSENYDKLCEFIGIFDYMANPKRELLKF